MPGVHHACALLALAGAGACLDIPPYRPCAGDRDCDGWPAVATNPGANDCDDDNVLVYPGAEDDPGTTAIEDCFATALASPLTPVAPLARGWSVGELALEFDSASAMPSSLRRGTDELLAGNNDMCLRDERFAGISLYPAFGVDARSTQTGMATTVRSGPALATTRVTWAQPLPMATTMFGCDAATTVNGVIDFTVHPSGRIVRRDQVTLSAGVSTCAGCGNAGGAAAIFTSYFAFPTALGRYQVDPAVDPSMFLAAGVAANLVAPATSITGCVSDAGAALPPVGMAWSFPTAIAGMRARTTNDTRANHAMIVDWVNTASVAAGTYELVTAVAVETDRIADCSRELRLAMTEFARPPTLTPTTFVPARGSYRFTGEIGAGVIITADQGVEGGAAVEVPTFGQRGLTVWTSTGGPYRRLRRGQDYLTQYEADDTSVVYLPAIAATTSIVIAGPGGEPPP